MSEEHLKSRAARYFDLHPEKRQQVMDSPAFKKKLAELEEKKKYLDIDGERLYYPWGDTGKDLDELIFDEGVERGVIHLQHVNSELDPDDS